MMFLSVEYKRTPCELLRNIQAMRVKEDNLYIQLCLIFISVEFLSHLFILLPCVTHALGMAAHCRRGTGGEVGMSCLVPRPQARLPVRGGWRAAEGVQRTGNEATTNAL